MGRIYDELELSAIKITSDVRYPPESDVATQRDYPVAQEAPAMEVYELDRSPTPAPPLTTLDGEAVLTPEDSEEVLKVSAHSRPSAVAGAIAGVIRHHGRAEVQAIGAGATNQAIKAVAIARDYLAPNGIDIVCVPAFIDVTIANEERTAIRLVIESRG
jgi:stage V sporulation protein S